MIRFWSGVCMMAMFAGAASAQQAAPPLRGKLLFLRCAACHDISAKQSAKIGPNLYGVFGRPSASLPGFPYSPAMKQAHLVWNAATLDRWLTRPGDLVPGTAMAFAGLPSAADRQAVIAYLRQTSAAPAPQ
jgi:cytochrome c